MSVLPGEFTETRDKIYIHPKKELIYSMYGNQMVLPPTNLLSQNRIMPNLQIYS